MNHILVFIVLLILIAINIIYYYSYNNNIKNHIKENFQDITKFENVTSLLSTNNNVKCSVYDPLRNCGYYAGYNNKTGRITKINFDNFTESKNIILNNVYNIESGFIDKKAEYAYFITNTQPSIIIRMELKSENIMYGILPPTYDNINLAVPGLDIKTTYGYFISTSSFSNDNKYILKVDLSTFTYAANLDNVVYYTLKYDNPIVSYNPTSTPSPSSSTNITYYNPSNNPYIKVGLILPDLVLKTNTYTKVIPSSITMDKFEENLYIGTNKGIIKYDMTNPNAFVNIPIYSKIFRAGPTSIFEERNPNKLYTTDPITSGIIDNTNQYGFFVTNTSNTSKLLKISLDRFTITQISLTSIGTKNMIIDYENNYLYGDSNNGKLFKMNISSNNITNLDLPNRLDINGSLITDKENRFLYATTSGNNNYIIKIKIKDYETIPTEDTQTTDLENINISNTNLPSSSDILKPNATIDNILEIQNSINSIINENSKTSDEIKDDLNKINTQMDNILKQQTIDHDKIINTVNLTINELDKTKNVITVEKTKINLKSNEPYLLQNIESETSTPQPTKEAFANLINNSVHPRINDFINFEPDWKIEWNKNIHNANINPLLVLP